MSCNVPLSDALGKLSLLDSDDHDDIDQFLFDVYDFPKNPASAVLEDKESIKHQLERDFLSPSPSFTAQWLDRFQQRWTSPIEYSDLFQIAPTQSRTISRFHRQGLEGRVSGHVNVTVPASSATAKNSTSFSRKPGTRSEFVRGASGFFPFAPGGLDSVEAAAAYEDSLQIRDDSGLAAVQKKLERVITLSGDGSLLETAPGLPRGIRFSKSNENASEATEVEHSLEEEPQQLGDNSIHAGGLDLNHSKQEEVIHDKLDPDSDGDSETQEDIDSLLPIEFPSLGSHGPLAASSARTANHQWAHMVDINKGIPDFHELVPDMAREWPFELDVFQKEAIYHLENGDSVFVAAHTSAGKTVVAEYAIALAAKHMTKAIYTSPIKALSNQKFRDFRQTFDDVGILTGDVQINADASCLIMTTEILRSMLYRGADIIRDVEFVIFDEVHYVNDFERGVVWEEVIIMLPEHVSLILLSATVPNTLDFASWVGRTKKKNIYVISTPKRPVPLEHYLWAGKDIHKIVDASKNFLESGWKQANAALKGRDKNKEFTQTSGRGGRGGGSHSQRGGGGNQRGSRGGGGQLQRGGRGGFTPRESHNPGHMGKTGRPGGSTSAAQDKTLWVQLVQFLKKQTLLPACIFVFSKKRCEENADALSNQDFCTAKEKSAIHMLIERSIARLKPEDRTLPQIIRLRELLSRGIAVHHGGLLPIVKELVELLFAETLVKVLFATETFAMGLNLPTRTVVFSGYRKHDGQSFRNLLPGEYTQMAGRAGRRGLDTVGSVIIVAPGSDQAPPVAELRTMMLGQPSKLRSQFRLTYNMILNLLRVEALKIEEMIKRSFSEHATQQLLPEHEKAVKISEADLAKIKRDACDICDKHMDSCHDAGQTYMQLTSDLYKGLISTPLGRRIFTPGRLIVLDYEGIRTFALLLANSTTHRGDPSNPSVMALVLKPSRDSRDSTDLLPFLPEFMAMYTPLQKLKKHVFTKVDTIPVSQIQSLTGTVVKSVIPEIFNGGEKYHKAKDILHRYCLEWNDKFSEMSLEKVQNLNLQDIIQQRAALKEAATDDTVMKCPNFIKHYAMCHDQWLIREKIVQLRQSLTDQNLQLLPDYEQRIEVLKTLNFIDSDTRILLKGKVACEIHSSDELVLTELILDNVLADYEPPEIAALLSAFVFQEKTLSTPTLTSNLERAKETIIEISKKVNDIQTTYQVIQSSEESNDFVSQPRFGLVEVVYEWARGMSFKNITNLTDVLEGTIVRTITRLDETCREVKNAARIIGDPELYQKMQTAQELIKRDITAVASLYM
ncbi:Antiviral helicase SKI2 [Ceratocystis fimbriata CBS 114723]|uniref:Antiviral helicase SKI2 n=1 Tax=Ceratocystis fimbriata CBS 114723 TaxID=1035309 RepID=A0A2C5X098_9PEZI|nr:Antiviral helicase SKI2 [Ceratocystis fimbriata CBS 114723]